VRFLKQTEARDASSFGKLVPRRCGDEMELHPFDEPRYKPLHPVQVGQRNRIATVSFDDPLAAGRHFLIFGLYCPPLLLSPALRTELGALGDGFSAIDTELGLGTRNGWRAAAGGG
jgi:hypothetical protein